MSENPPQPEYDIALYIDEPYASYIKQGIQTLYVDVEKLSPELLNAPLVLVGAKAYGTITLSNPSEISQEKFNEARDSHRIDMTKQSEYGRERAQWLSGPFYSYTFKFDPFPVPLDYEDYEEVEKKCSGRRKIKKLTPLAKADVCPDCGKDPCECDEEEDVCPECGKSPCECEDMEKAVWTTSYKNNLPDSSFAYISPGGKKDREGKTVPRSLRHLPYKGADGKVDRAHVRNALARLPQTQIPSEAKASAHAKLVAAAKEVGVDASVKKSMEPDITERPSAYEVIVNKVPDGWTLEAERHDNHFIILMKHTENSVVKTKIHAILFDKSLCPCAIAKIDYTPYALWTSTLYNAERPPIPSDIPLKD